MGIFNRLFISIILLLINFNVNAQEFKYRYKADGVIYGEKINNINYAPIINSSNLPNGYVGTAYSYTISGSDSNGDILSWSWSGNIPAGLSLNSSTGNISGIPSLDGVYNVQVELTDDINNPVNKSFSISVFDCSTASIGTVCEDGAVYVGSLDGIRRYVAANDLSSNKFFGINDISLESIPGYQGYGNDGETNTDLLTPSYDSYNDGFRVGTAAQDCRNELGSEWYLPSLNELLLIEDNISSFSSDFLDTFSDTYYWTSSQSGTEGARLVNILTADNRGSLKNVEHFVRCYRK